MQIGEKVVSGFRWLAVGKFAGQIVTWAVTIYVIRILTPEDYGLMAMAMVVIGFLALFDEMGMGAALVQQETLDDGMVAQVFGLVIIINFSAFALLIAISPLIADFFGEPRLIEITWVLAVQFPLLAAQIVPDAMLRRKMQFRKKSMVNFVAMVAGSIATLGLAIVGHGVWALVLGSVTTAFFRAIGLIVAAGYFCMPSFNFTDLGRVVKFGTQVTGERVLWFVYSQADIFLVGRVLGKELLGYYSVAMHLASLPMTKLGAIVNEVSFVGFSRIQSDAKEVSRQFLKATKVITVFAFPVFFGISSVAPEIVSSVLGGTWSLSAEPLQIISLVIPLRMLDLVIPTALLGTGRADVSVVNAAIATVILPASFLIGLDWGLIGVCYAWLIGYSIYFIIALIRSLPRLGVGFTEYFVTIAGIAGSSITMLVIVHATRTQLPPAWAGNLSQLAVLIATGAATFGLLALCFHRESLQFALRLVRR